ncbi:MAG: hypothetical protein ACOCXT_02570 [Candidatus Dojkabacteria bacterium]
MGVRINAKVKLDTSSNTGNIGEIYQRTFQKIANFFESDSHILKEFLDIHFMENELRVTLHPASEPIFFISENEFLFIEVKTNPAGPGFHAYVTDILDRLARVLQTTFDQNNLEDYADYYFTRDFHQLQWGMVEWFIANATHVLKNSSPEANITM